LFIFLVIVSLFRDEFVALAEKYQTRIVFNPRVYGFFSLASGLFLSAALFFGERFEYVMSRGVLFTLLLFRTWVALFSFFPIKTRQVQRTVFWSFVFWLTALAILTWSSLRGLVSGWLPNLPDILPWNLWTTQPQTNTWENTDSGDSGEVIKTGVTLDDLESMLPTGTTATGANDDAEVSTGTQVDSWIWSTVGTTDTELPALENNAPVTYRVLLPYLDSKGLLAPITQQPTFTNVGSQESIYPAFQRAWGMKMIGTNVNPDWQVRCENLMVLIWLAKNRTVNSSLPVLTAYREAAAENNARGSCLSRAQVSTQDMLNDI
jgi:hypothetical protein